METFVMETEKIIKPGSKADLERKVRFLELRLEQIFLVADNFYKGGEQARKVGKICELSHKKFNDDDYKFIQTFNESFDFFSRTCND